MVNHVFSHVLDKSESELFSDQQVINNRAFRWKMQFNSDQNNQVQDVYFSWKPENENSLL